MTPTRECRRCGRSIPKTPSGHLRAHACEHGRACILSYVARRRGDTLRRCKHCALACQLPLFRELDELAS
jgi:hypothetical protein